MDISQRAEELFIKARTLDPATQAKFISDACGTDATLFREVTSLLAASNESEAYFDSLSGKIGLAALADEEQPLPENKVIGSWRLLRMIGRGGMGSVYLAERADEQFEKRAALKILPFGLDGEQARSRFLTERQILAQLVHDNIARLLDGGVTEEGTPYFVMDYVEGVPIDEYCSNRNLNVDQRLRLMLDVARAIQFAHRNLIVHRDLKPGNVLVEEDGRVRLLDFGIAKVMEPSAIGMELTQVAMRPVTPAFASPEMLCGEAVDVTTDVYSIGVLLYLLLTGRLPLSYEGLSAAEMRSRAKSASPPAVSSIDDRPGNDVDAIVAKALATSPAERYESVESLANDIRHYLDGMPVAAKAPSVLYRARKFVGRHRVGVAFTAFAGLALLAIALMAIDSAVTYEKQAAEIALERDRAEQTKDFLIDIFDSADPNREASDMTAREILDAGRQRIATELAGQPEVQADLLAAMSEVYAVMRVTPEWREVLQNEQEIRRNLTGTDSSGYAKVLVGLSQVEDMAGNYDASEEYAREALTVSTRLGDSLGQAAGYTRLGRVLHLKGDYAGADPAYRHALAMYQSEYGDEDLRTAQVKLHIATLLEHQQQHQDAYALMQQVLATREKLVRGDNSEFADILLAMGSTLTSLGRLDEATESYQRAFAMNDRLFGPDNSYNLYVVNGLGKVAEERGDYTAAAARYEDAIRLMKLHSEEGANLGIAHANLGKAYTLNNRYDLALPFYRDALEILERYIPGHWILGDVSWRYARCMVDVGDFAAAEPLILDGIEVLTAQWGAGHETVKNAKAAARTLYESWGKPDRASEFR